MVLLSKRHTLKHFIGCRKTEVEVWTEQAQAATSPVCQELRELRAQIATLITKMEELQTALQQQSTPAQPPPWVQPVCHWCRKPHFQHDCRARQLYEQQQQGQQHSTIQDCDQSRIRLYIQRRGRGQRFSSQWSPLPKIRQQGKWTL